MKIGHLTAFTIANLLLSALAQDEEGAFSYCGESCTIWYFEHEVNPGANIIQATDEAALSSLSSSLSSEGFSITIASEEIGATVTPHAASVAGGAFEIPCCGTAYSVYYAGVEFGDESCIPSRTFDFPIFTRNDNPIATVFVTAIAENDDKVKTFVIDDAIGSNPCETGQMGSDVLVATKTLVLVSGYASPTDGSYGGSMTTVTPSNIAEFGQTIKVEDIVKSTSSPVAAVVANDKKEPSANSLDAAPLTCTNCKSQSNTVHSNLCLFPSVIALCTIFFIRNCLFSSF